MSLMLPLTFAGITDADASVRLLEMNIVALLQYVGLVPDRPPAPPLELPKGHSRWHRSVRGMTLFVWDGLRWRRKRKDDSPGSWLKSGERNPHGNGSLSRPTCCPTTDGDPNG